MHYLLVHSVPHINVGRIFRRLILASPLSSEYIKVSSINFLRPQLKEFDYQSHSEYKTYPKIGKKERKTMTTSTTFLRRTPGIFFKRRMFSSNNTAAEQVPKDVAAPHGKLSAAKLDPSVTTQASEVWYQSKRIPLYITMAGAFSLIAYAAQLRYGVHDVQADPAKRNNPIDTDAPSTKENIQMVSAVVKDVKGEELNPQGLGVDPKEWDQAKELYRSRRTT